MLLSYRKTDILILEVMENFKNYEFVNAKDISKPLNNVIDLFISG